MARQPKTKSPAEIKAARKDLQAAIKTINDGLKPHEAAAKEAEKALALAKKEADKAVAAAQKTAAAAAAKLQKAKDAADKGRAKLEAKLAELEPAAAPL